MKIKMILREFYIAPSRLGERLNWAWLTYNFGVFLEFDVIAKRDAPLFCEAMVEVFPDARSFCDVGCGTGRYAKFLNDCGKTTIAFEYTKSARDWARGRGVDVRHFDVSVSEKSDLVQRVDVAYSLEVAEHVPAQYAEKFVKFLTSCSDNVVFTAAQIGQSGVGHVNCQPASYWIELFAKHGYEINYNKHDILKKRLGSEARLSRFLVNNLIVFNLKSR